MFNEGKRNISAISLIRGLIKIIFLCYQIRLIIFGNLEKRKKKMISLSLFSACYYTTISNFT